MKKITFLLSLLCATALNSMEKKFYRKKSLATDFEIYQLLSFAAKNDPQFYPPELVQVITIIAHEITEERMRKEIEIEIELKRMRPHLIRGRLR